MKLYETVIGLEVHVELATKTKIFCACSTAFGGLPNTHTCPVCIGMPGTLPVLNQKVVEHAIAVGLACGSHITRKTIFDRKNYFYPDNPQNYQISQLYAPICIAGSIGIVTETGEKEIRIHEMHMEEDAGKLIHEGEHSYIDYNRSGVPLLEIVTEPDFRNAKEVIAFLEKLRLIIQYLGASDCKLQEGSMRVDVNLSVRPFGETKLGTRTEMKNLGSFRSILRAVEHETKRQIEQIEQGHKIVQETRRWNENEECSYSMRSKETVRDYRYFKEPDVLPLFITEDWIERVRVNQPELREEKQKRYMLEYALPEYDVEILTSAKELADLFEETVKLCHAPKEVSNWIMTEVMRLLKESGKDIKDTKLNPEHFSNLITLVLQKKVNRTVAKEVFEKVFEQGIEPLKYITEQGLLLVDQEEYLEEAVEKVLKEFPQCVQDYKNGKEKIFGYLVGQTMKVLNGKASPQKVQEVLKQKLNKK